MTRVRQKWINAIIILSMLVIITGIFILVVTFGGSFSSPDATVTYTKHTLTWDKPMDESGSAVLDIFGEPETEGDLPIIDPTSKGKYYVRLSNRVDGRVNYSVYLYCENEHNIPLEFSITRSGGMKETDNIPSDLEGKQVLDKVCGTLQRKSMENFEIDWYWNTQSDEADTELGNMAARHEVSYTIHMLVVVEDNNTYYFSGAGGDARMLHRAYVNGYPEGDFRPEGKTTRGETAAIFARILANYDETALKSVNTEFPDVSKSAWYAKYVSYLSDEGIIYGYPDGTFLPDESITRAEFVAICVRYFEKTVGKIEADSKAFSDLEKSHWGYEVIQKAVSQGYITGYPDGSVRPDARITRAEVVTVVNRMLGRSADTKFVDKNKEELMQFSDLKDNSHWGYYEIAEAANTHHLRFLQNKEFWM